MATLAEVQAALAVTFPNVQFTAPAAHRTFATLQEVRWLAVDGGEPVQGTILVSELGEAGEAADTRDESSLGTIAADLEAWLQDLSNRPWDAVVRVRPILRAHRTVLVDAVSETDANDATIAVYVVFRAASTFQARKITNLESRP